MNGDGAGSVLIVDDDEDIRTAMIDAFEEAGYQVAGAKNGSEALALLQSGLLFPGLIVLDIMMPVMDGYEFRRRQLQDAGLAPIPVVVLSASVPASQEMSDLRVSAFLKKPIQLTELYNVAERFCTKPAA
jgi:CheY-like chemotaxis protein